MYTIQFVEAFVRDRERQLLAAADRRGGSRRSEKARQLAEGEDRAPADQPCCAPVAA